ncbi:MAG: hypothetical protein WCF36_06090 [Candidatus Nanopelagicales bacterium]
MKSTRGVRAATALIVSGVLIAFAAACTSSEQEPTGQASNASSASSPVASPAPASTDSAVSASASLRDPMIDLADNVEAGWLVGAQPLLSEQGTATGEYPLTEPPGIGEVMVTVSCVGPGRSTVTNGDGDLLLGAPCDGPASGSIRLREARLGTKISVTAPTEYWLVIAPVSQVG